MQTLSSKAVAEMLGKRHDNFMRDVRKYVATLGDAAPDYFHESTYKDGLNKQRAGYEITLKGCELVAGRIIGSKSEGFKAQYKAVFNVPAEPVEAPSEAQGYSTEDVAQVLGCSRRTVQRMIQRGELATTQIVVMVPSTKTVVTAEELARYQKERAAENELF